jgi:hypothetical protein
MTIKGKFTGYAKTASADQVRAAFAAKHGYPPAEVHDGGTIWLVGPVETVGCRAELSSVATQPVEQLRLI